MNKPIIYSLEQIRSFDIANGWNDTQIGFHQAFRMMLGATGDTVWSGFQASQHSPASLVVNINEGWIIAPSATNTNPYGPLPADSTLTYQCGYLSAGTVTVTTGALSAGKSQWVLLEVAFQQVDAIRASDPNGGVLPYVNINNPGQPLQGPNGSGVSQNTVRQGVAVITANYGTPATSGSEVPPTTNVGNVPMYLIDMTFGQTTITNGQILVAGNAAYSGYPDAPIFPGIIGSAAGPNASGSHHGGIPGQGNKILLTNGLEVQGIASFTNLPVTNSSPPAVGGIVTFAGEIPVESQGTSSPSGVLAGMRGDFYFDTVQDVFWICTSSGSSSTAVWAQVGTGGIAQYVNTFPLTMSPGNIMYLCDTTSGAGSCTLRNVNSMGGTSVGFKNIGTNNMVLTPLTGQTFEGLAMNASYTLFPNTSIRWWPNVGNTTWYQAS